MPATSRSASRPPPVGGWDTRNALADMPEVNAVILDNWFPSTDEVILRRGHASHATGLGAAVESLLEYTGTDGTSELFGAAGGNIYDVTGSGAVGSAVVSGMTNARWQHVNMGTSGGQFMPAFNGADTPRLYDGSTWSTMSITGPTAANVITGNVHQRRLWLIERGSLSAWYGAVNAIGGTFTEFPLYGLARRGGYLMAMGTWSRDAGDGADDVAVFLTSEGEALVYAGTDPASASTWALVGVFRIGKPIGRRCMLKAGADLVMVTEDGFVAASSILSLDRARAEQVALSRQINKAVNDAVRLYKGNYGWQPILYPFGQMLIFNIPKSSTTADQYVFNTITGAPCRFTSMHAICWGLRGDDIFFGRSDGSVYQFDTGTNDNGATIDADGAQAFDYFGSPGRKKAFKLVEPVFRSIQDPQAAIDVNVDYQLRSPTGVSSSTSTGYAIWGVSKWGVGIWAPGTGTTWSGWRSVTGHGHAAGVRVRVSTSVARPAWTATNWIYQPGGLK